MCRHGIPWWIAGTSFDSQLSSGIGHLCIRDGRRPSSVRKAMWGPVIWGQGQVSSARHCVADFHSPDHAERMSLQVNIVKHLVIHTQSSTKAQRRWLNSACICPAASGSLDSFHQFLLHGFGASVEDKAQKYQFLWKEDSLWSKLTSFLMLLRAVRTWPRCLECRL